MNRPLADDIHLPNSSLILFLTGEAPRSRRALRSLRAALDTTGLDLTPAREIDLLQEPREAINFGIFATPRPAAHRCIGKAQSTLWGPSDAHRLRDFLSGL